MPDSLVLIDGHSLAFRAYHALPSTLTAADGKPANAIYGFVGMLLRLISDYRPEYLAVVFDVGIPFRASLYDRYKAGRLELDPEVERQVAGLRRILAAMEIPVFELEGYEADDIMKTLAAQAEAAGLNTLIVTGDRDLFQIVTARTSVLYLTRGVDNLAAYGPEEVEARYGVRPDQFRDFKALVGDPSDNVPGVRGIGEKTAARLLQRFGSLEGVYAGLDGVQPMRLRGLLDAAESREGIDLARRLVTLVEVPGIHLELERCRIAYDREHARSVLAEFGFRRFQERLP